MQGINCCMLGFSQCGPQAPNEKDFFFIFLAANFLLQYKCQE